MEQSPCRRVGAHLKGLVCCNPLKPSVPTAKPHLAKQGIQSARVPCSRATSSETQRIVPGVAVDVIGRVPICPKIFPGAFRNTRVRRGLFRESCCGPSATVLGCSVGRVRAAGSAPCPRQLCAPGEVARGVSRGAATAGVLHGNRCGDRSGSRHVARGAVAAERLPRPLTGVPQVGMQTVCGDPTSSFCWIKRPGSACM